MNSGWDDPREYGEMHDVDVVMYGHTHVPFIEIGDDMTILNPGSISYPRQAGRKPTFLLMDDSMIWERLIMPMDIIKNISEN